jgi:hypothetical protein
MRASIAGLAVGLLCMASASASPPVSRELMLPLAGKASIYTAPEDAAGPVPNIAPGQPLGIACADASDTKAQLRVVMTFANDTGETPTGYGALLATDWKVSHGMVHVRVPDLPGLSNHTVEVRVFVMGRRGTHICDVGRVRVS